MFIDLTRSPIDTQNISISNPLYNKGTYIQKSLPSEIPFEYCRTKGLIFDVRGKESINIDFVSRNLIRKKNFIIFRTGLMENYGYGSQDYFNKFPEFTDELINFLVTKNLSFIGIDAPDIKKENADFVNQYCENAGVYIVRNLCGLENIKDTSYMLNTMWFDDPNADYLKCRVILEMEYEKL